MVFASINLWPFFVNVYLIDTKITFPMQLLEVVTSAWLRPKLNWD